MKTLQIVLLAISAFVVFLSNPLLFAADEPTAKDEMTEAPSHMDDEASTPEGQTRVTQRLTERYNVTEKQVTDLRAQHLGYGEIDKTLGLAKQMPGGITDENIKKVTQLREGDGHKTGWGNVAKELDLKPSSWHSQADKSETSEHVKSDTSEHTEHSSTWKNSPQGHMDSSGAKSGSWASHGGGGGQGRGK